MGKELSMYNLSYKHFDDLESHLKGSPLAPLLMYVHHPPQWIYQPWTQYLIILCFPWTFSCEKNTKQLIKYVVEATWKKLCNKVGTLNINLHIYFPIGKIHIPHKTSTKQYYNYSTWPCSIFMPLKHGACNWHVK